MCKHPQYVVSLAYCCEVWQIDYGVVFDEIQRRGIEPALWINGVAHYDAAGLEQILCDLENAGRIDRSAFRLPSYRAKIIHAAGTKRTRPPCHPTS